MEECQICFIFNESYISLSCCNKQLCSNCLSKVNFCPYCRAEIKNPVVVQGLIQMMMHKKKKMKMKY